MPVRVSVYENGTLLDADAGLMQHEMGVQAVVVGLVARLPGPLQARGRQIVKNAVKRLLRGFAHFYPWVPADQVEEYEDASGGHIRTVRETSGARIYAHGASYSAGLRVTDRYWRFQEYPTGPAAGHAAYRPPYGLGSRLWRWAQRQNGLDPDLLLDEIAARAPVPKGQYRRYSGAGGVAKHIEARGTAGMQVWSDFLAAEMTRLGTEIRDLTTRPGAP